ncbi:helix-turn-helix domain-containing protein [Spirosoma montaniterrae]
MPNAPNQQSQLALLVGCVRFVYNLVLEFLKLRWAGLNSMLDYKAD